MSLFNNILDGITKQLKGKELDKENIALSLSDMVGLTITADQIQIKNGVLFISTSPTIKSTIRLKQKKILERLKQYKIKTIG